MAAVDQIVFTHREVAEALVRREGIQEGIWGVSIEFGLTATLIGAPDSNLLPAAIVPVLKIGIRRFPEMNSLTVDAAKIAGAANTTKGAGSRKKGKSKK